MYKFSLELTIILIILVGFFSSLIASIIGLGGGLVAIPLIMLVIGEHSLEAKMISYVSISFLSIMAIFKYWKQKRVPDWGTAFLLLIGVLPATVLSSMFLGPLLNNKDYKYIFHFLYAIVALGVLLLINFKDKIKMEKLKNNTLPFIGAFIGLLSGSIGLSGGVLFVPVLVVGLKKTLKEAAVTSLVLKLVTAFMNVITGASLGYYHGLEENSVYWFLPLIIIIGALIGSFIGPTFQKKLSNKMMMICFTSVMSLIILWELIDASLILVHIF